MKKHYKIAGKKKLRHAKRTKNYSQNEQERSKTSHWRTRHDAFLFTFLYHSIFAIFASKNIEIAMTWNIPYSISWSYFYAVVMDDA